MTRWNYVLRRDGYFIQHFYVLKNCEARVKVLNKLHGKDIPTTSYSSAMSERHRNDTAIHINWIELCNLDGSQPAGHLNALWLTRQRDIEQAIRDCGEAVVRQQNPVDMAVQKLFRKWRVHGRPEHSLRHSSFISSATTTSSTATPTPSSTTGSSASPASSSPPTPTGPTSTPALQAGPVAQSIPFDRGHTHSSGTAESYQTYARVVSPPAAHDPLQQADPWNLITGDLFDLSYLHPNLPPELCNHPKEPSYHDNRSQDSDTVASGSPAFTVQTQQDQSMPASSAFSTAPFTGVLKAHNAAFTSQSGLANTSASHKSVVTTHSMPSLHQSRSDLRSALSDPGMLPNKRKRYTSQSSSKNDEEPVPKIIIHTTDSTMPTIGAGRARSSPTSTTTTATRPIPTVASNQPSTDVLQPCTHPGTSASLMPPPPRPAVLKHAGPICGQKKAAQNTTNSNTVRRTTRSGQGVTLRSRHDKPPSTTLNSTISPRVNYVAPGDGTIDPRMIAIRPDLDDFAHDGREVKHSDDDQEEDMTEIELEDEGMGLEGIMTRKVKISTHFLPKDYGDEERGAGEEEVVDDELLKWYGG